jgi:erythronate-4-phosphate dehydrogenase
MRIICDIHIPYLVEAVQKNWSHVDICPMEAEQIDAATVRDAEVLIVRTRTRVDAHLLEGTRVRMVCTATIGFDHIDTAYCEAHGIRWMACPGCNAQAVCDYIEEAIEEFRIQNSEFKPQTIGVVGVGNVGSLVAEMAERKGMHVLLNDPPKGLGVGLDEIARQSDIITFHVPLDDTTRHLCDEHFLSQCQPNALIINSSRGGVVDEQALIRSGRPFILDTWENEPEIDRRVADCALRASMHIAGYSVEGKRKASQMCLDAITQAFDMPAITLPHCASTGDTRPGWIARISDQLKARPEEFETLRKEYILR